MLRQPETVPLFCSFALGFSWDEVRRKPFAVGELVERRDDGRDWSEGFVTQLEPMKINCSSTDP